MQQKTFIGDLIACSTCFGHHYAHHQELESVIQVVAACRIWCFVFKLSVWCGAEGCVSGLRAVALLNSATARKPDTICYIKFLFQRFNEVNNFLVLPWFFIWLHKEAVY